MAYYRGDYASAADQFAEVVDIWEDRFGEDHPDVLTALNNLGAARREAGEYDAAERMYRHAMAQNPRIQPMRGACFRSPPRRAISSVW